MPNLEIKLSTEEPIHIASLPNKIGDLNNNFHKHEINYNIELNPLHYVGKEGEFVDILICKISDFKGEKEEADKIYGILEDLGYEIMNKEKNNK